MIDLCANVLNNFTGQVGFFRVVQTNTLAVIGICVHLRLQIIGLCLNGKRTMRFNVRDCIHPFLENVLQFYLLSSKMKSFDIALMSTSYEIRDVAS